MNILGFLSIAVYATELIISPLPDVIQEPIGTTLSKPAVHFGQLAVSPPIVLGITEPSTPSTSPTSTTPTPALTTIPTLRHLKKDSYTIAFLGDSMIDTLGPGIPNLADKLKKSFPGAVFTLLNYGNGGTNIQYGITRLTQDHQYLGQPVPALVKQKPDIVVVESFGYNPFPRDEGVLDEHWLAMATIVDTLKREVPGVKVMFAATIAPSAAKFGEGAPFVNFSAEGKKRKADEIKRYIESTRKFAHGEGYPLADVYATSLTSSGYGNERYINPGDHIHYSDEGRELFAQKVFETLLSAKLLE